MRPNSPSPSGRCHSTRSTTSRNTCCLRRSRWAHMPPLIAPQPLPPTVDNSLSPCPPPLHLVVIFPNHSLVVVVTYTATTIAPRVPLWVGVPLPHDTISMWSGLSIRGGGDLHLGHCHNSMPSLLYLIMTLWCSRWGLHSSHLWLPTSPMSPTTTTRSPLLTPSAQ
jgi:hypothetical protein